MVIGKGDRLDRRGMVCCRIIPDRFQPAGVVIGILGFLVFGVDLFSQVAGIVIIIGGFLSLGPGFFNQPVVAVIFKPGGVALCIGQGRQVVAVVKEIFGSLIQGK